MELRQLRYFVTLAEELHFGRAAEREHIVQSALSQQVQRLERELGVRLLERSTHHVALTAAGVVFLVEARQILAHVDRAAQAARSAVAAGAPLRVGIIDSSYDSMPQILHEVQARYPGLVIHQVEASVPEQYQLLIDGRLDVGVGRAALAPPQIASLLFRQDPLGVLVPDGHRFAELEGVSVAVLAEEPLLLAEEAQAPEFNQFTVEMCRAAGFTPTVYEGHRGEHPRGRRSRGPGTLPVLRALLLYRRASRNHLAAADRTRVLLPVVGPVARGRRLRPRTRRRQLRAGDVKTARLAHGSRPGGTVADPQTAHPVTTRRRSVWVMRFAVSRWFHGGAGRLADSARADGQVSRRRGGGQPGHDPPPNRPFADRSKEPGMTPPQLTDS